MARFDENIFVKGSIERTGLLLPSINRLTEIAAETIIDWIPLTQFRVWDGGGQLLPATAATDDLALIHGTWGTEPLHLSAGDLKAAGATTRYGRVQWKLKDTYVNGTAVKIIVLAGVQTTVADTSCVLNVACYSSDEDMTVTAATISESNVDINAANTYADKTFTIASSAYALFTNETELDIRVAITCTDAATGTAVEPTILGVGIQQSCKGG